MSGTRLEHVPSSFRSHVMSRCCAKIVQDATVVGRSHLGTSFPMLFWLDDLSLDALMRVVGLTDGSQPLAGDHEA